MSVFGHKSVSLSIKRKIKGLLKGAKLRQTEARAAILTVLYRSRKPQTADRIAEKLSCNSIDRVTVYRNLESFFKAGFVHKAFLQKRAWHYELSDRCTERQCHPHFTCTSCGDTHCLTEMPTLITKVLPKGFVIRHQRVLLEGLCPQCNNANT